MKSEIQHAAGLVCDKFQTLAFHAQRVEQNSRSIAAGRSRITLNAHDVEAEGKRIKIAASEALQALARLRDAVEAEELNQGEAA